METHISNPELKCPVCAHKSVSIKSLYGHMRNHPDRNWRGMKPPIPGIKNNIFPCLPVSGLESDGDTHSGSGLLFPGWSKTRRRTRTRPGKSPMISQALSAPDNEYPTGLIRIRPEKARVCTPASNQALPGSDKEGYDFPVLENGERVTGNLPPKKRKLESGLPSNTGNSKSKNPYPNRPLIRNDSRKFVRILNPGPESSNENPSRTRKPHVCDICDRAFKSYQALGGHKSHHNNNKAHGEDNESSTTVVVYGEWPEGRCCGVVHRCPFCDKMFSKGQALGGHKRHCRRKMCRGQETRNGQFRFDLNELPPEWVPEETAGTNVACE